MMMNAQPQQTCQQKCPQIDSWELQCPTIFMMSLQTEERYNLHISYSVTLYIPPEGDCGLDSDSSTSLLRVCMSVCPKADIYMRSLAT